MSNNLKGKLSIGKGDRGDAGLSAYEVAINNGYKGTVEEWLYDLKGEPFIYEDFTPEQLEELKPKKGVDYFDGANGEDGTNGLSAYELWLEEGNSGSIQDFLDSLKGENGEDGKNGVSPEELKEVFAEKIHEHDYAAKEHQHSYSEIGHTHNYAEKDHTHSEFDHEHPEYAPKHHEHQEYAPTTHNHEEYALKSEIGTGNVNIEELEGIFAKKEHTHPEIKLDFEYPKESFNWNGGYKYVVMEDIFIEDNETVNIELTADKEYGGIGSVQAPTTSTYLSKGKYIVNGWFGQLTDGSGSISGLKCTILDTFISEPAHVSAGISVGGTNKILEVETSKHHNLLKIENKTGYRVTVKKGGYLFIEKPNSYYATSDHTHKEIFKTLTEEEYALLSEEEKMNGVIYFVY